jgi:aryl-alcohol dehydrogenase-like predicted oxidoreductase
MRYRRLQRTDLDVSAISLGCAEFGGSTAESDAFDLLDRYVDGGGNFIDTASFYGRWFGNSERYSEAAIGRWMKARRNRASIIVGTKGGHPEFSPGFESRPLIHRLSRVDIASDLDASLTHLGTEVIDVYWLHYDEPARPVAEMIDALEEHVHAGKIRYYGCCNWSAARFKEAHAYCESRELRGFVASQVLWNLASHNRAALWVDGMQSMSIEMRAFHRETGVAAVPYSAQAGGFFSKIGRADFLQNPHFSRLRACYLNIESMRRAERVAQFAQETGHDATQIALACLVNQPFATVPIVGPRNAQQLSSCLAAADLELDAVDIAFLARC